MKLLTEEQRARLLVSGDKTARGLDHDPYPVVKLFTPDAAATWLLSEWIRAMTTSRSASPIWASVIRNSGISDCPRSRRSAASSACRSNATLASRRP
jgi:hypothetical protein